MELLKLAMLDRAATDRLFAEADLPPPLIVFDPPDSALGHTHLKTYARYCDKLADRPGGPIRRDRFRMENFGSMADFLFVAERGGGAGRDDWHFTFSGAELDAARGASITGRRLDDLPPSNAELFKAVWQEAARDGGHRVLTEHRPPQERHMLLSSWRNLCVPLTSDGDGLRRVVDGFVCLSLPEITLSTGLDAVPDAVLLVDGENRVRLANRAARELFERGPADAPRMRDLADYTNSDLVLFGAPETARSAPRKLRQVCRCVLGGTVLRMDALVSTLTHNGCAYFVVSLRPVC